jgi:hypothetical protein
LSVKSVFSKHGDMFVPEDLNVRVRISIAQHLQRWQSKDKIANRAAADHQNAVHVSIIAAMQVDLIRSDSLGFSRIEGMAHLAGEFVEGGPAASDKRSRAGSNDIIVP